MSWQQFVDESLLGTSQVAKASIHGLDGTRYASSAGFVVCLSVNKRFNFLQSYRKWLISLKLVPW